MAFLTSIEQMRAIDWAAKYLWDIRFPTTGGSVGAPSPFADWFPAVDVEVDEASLESHSFEIGDTSMVVPLRTTHLTMKITFLDNDQNVLFNWLKTWMNSSVRRENRTVATVKEAARQVQIVKLDRQRRQISSAVYWVVPEGKLGYNGSSEDGPHTYSMSFNIVG